MLKIGGTAVCKALFNICSKIWDSEFWPELWTQSIIICLFKKGDRSRCENYRTISLINHSSKILLNIICQQLKPHLHRILSQEQAGFQEHRSTVEQIFTLQQLVEKHVKRQNKRIAQAFIDYKKAFDCIWHAALFQVLDHYGIPTKLCNLIANLYNRAVSAVKCNGHIGKWFRTTMGSRQGCILSPDLFNIYIENIMSLALDKTIGVGVLVGGHLFNNLQFADDIALLAGSADDLQHLLDSVSSVSLAYGMEISGPKTQTMCISKEHEGLSIKLYGNDLEQVTEFTYLGSCMAENNSSNAEVCTRIAKALSSFGRLQNVWKDKEVSLTTKVKLLQTLVFPIICYACETWTLKADVTHRLEAFEMQCYCHLLNIKWQDHITNVEVLT